MKAYDLICPCCSGELYANCCQPYHSREKDAPTAEALMRSRFAAFAIPNGAYLMETTLPKKRKFHNIYDLQEWGEINTWTKLEIVRKPSDDHVEFKAYYTTKMVSRSFIMNFHCSAKWTNDGIMFRENF